MNVRRSFHWLFALVAMFCFVSAAVAVDPVRHVSAKVPVQGQSRELAAERAATAPSQAGTGIVARPPNPWKLLATIPGAVIHDIAFPTPQIGYAVAEGGQVWKTTNGGSELDRNSERELPLLLVRRERVFCDRPRDLGHLRFLHVLWPDPLEPRRRPNLEPATFN